MRRRNGEEGKDSDEQGEGGEVDRGAAREGGKVKRREEGRKGTGSLRMRNKKEKEGNGERYERKREEEAEEGEGRKENLPSNIGDSS